MPDTAPTAPSGPKQNNSLAEIRSILGLALQVIGLHRLIACRLYIPSESMMPGLLVGDRLIVSKYPYGWAYASATFHFLPIMKGRLCRRMPERGDIVIVAQPGSGKDLIKRVIGLPGDRIQLVGGRL